MCIFVMIIKIKVKVLFLLYHNYHTYSSGQLYMSITFFIQGFP